MCPNEKIRVNLYHPYNPCFIQSHQAVYQILGFFLNMDLVDAQQKNSSKKNVILS